MSVAISYSLFVFSHLLTIEHLHEVKADNEELKASLAASELTKCQLQKELDARDRDIHLLNKEKDALLSQVCSESFQLQ